MAGGHQCDVVVVGAGPAGLSAARTVARLGFKTVVVERLASPGDGRHARHAVVTPISDLVSGRPFRGGLFFPPLDLLIPESLVSVTDAWRRCLSPSGLEFQTVFADDGGVFSAIVDENGLLRLMAEQTASSGTKFRFGTGVTGLLYEGSRVVGVRTTRGDIRAELVIAAEGDQGQLCEQAGLCPAVPFRRSLALVVDIELEAPAVAKDNLGQLVVLGNQSSLGPKGFASLLTPEPGRAHLSLMGRVTETSRAGAQPASYYLAKYSSDRRVSDLLAGARPVQKSSYLVPMRSAPVRIVCDGFMASGDAIAPAGRLGVLSAMYLGRQAAFFAAEALDAGDPSAAALAPYDELYRTVLLPDLEAEASATLAMMEMTDRELDRLCEVLNALHLPMSFLGSRARVEWETVSWLVRQLPLADVDCALLQRILQPSAGSSSAQDGQGARVPCQAEVLVN